MKNHLDFVMDEHKDDKSWDESSVQRISSVWMLSLCVTSIQKFCIQEPKSMSETNQPSSETLLTQPVSRLFFQYFRSNLVSSLMLAVYVLFDTIFIGWGVGSQGLAALNITLPCYSLEIGFAR